MATTSNAAMRKKTPFHVSIFLIHDTRIDGGDYGYCESCGVEIGLERMQARPTATLCIDCKTLEEIRERQIAK